MIKVLVGILCLCFLFMGLEPVEAKKIQSLEMSQKSDFVSQDFLSYDDEDDDDWDDDEDFQELSAKKDKKSKKKKKKKKDKQKS